VHPALGSLYAQDNINFGGMILNFGLRVDYWFPGKYVDDAVKDTNVITIPQEIRDRYYQDTFGWFNDRRFKARLSPRLGISHPISDFQTLFFSYGHFSKWPKPQFVYAKLNPASAQSSFQKFGNPDLDPETTVAYELGLKTQFTPDDVLTVTAYYKDIYDYVSTRSAIITSSRLLGQSFITYVNTDYARSRGLERGDLQESIREEYMSWDRPVTASASVNFYVPPGSFDFGENIIDNWNIYLRAFFQSGKRYTPVVFTGAIDADGRKEYDYVVGGERYRNISDNWFYIDLNFEKYFDLSDLRFSFFIEINNLLDTKNSTIINPVTGRAYEYGDDVPSSWNDPRFPDLQAPISPYPFNPARYLTRRNIKFGVTFNF
ncbi:MAG: TonB-dependent receptor, partial [Ignavibacteriaceae bacterium]